MVNLWRTDSAFVPAAGALALSFLAGYLLGHWRAAADEDLAWSDEESDDGGDAEGDGVQEECKMILGVRMDLKMDKGKIAAQCGHASLAAYRAAKRSHPQYVRTWQLLGQTKIAVKIPTGADLEQLEERARALRVPFRTIQDAGRTQVEPGSRTVIGLGPAPIPKMDELTRQFKLL